MIQAFFALFTLVCFAACGGSRSSLPPLGNESSIVHHGKAHAGTVGTDLVAIDAGGAASGGFAADTDFANTGTWTYAVANAIDTTTITNAAPQAVYQSQRTGSNIVYTVGGLTPGTTYTTTMSFAELWWTAAAKRVFNVSVNNTVVLSKFDIFAVAGARYKAITESFSATATSSGTIVVALTAVTDNAAINAIEIAPIATPAPTPSSASPASGALLIDAGGTATGNFIADADFTSNGTWSYANSATISTAGVSSPAPLAVYQSARNGATITYTIPGLTAGAAYGVRLDFAELWFSATGQRVFNVSINNAQVLTNFDIVAAAGGALKAVNESFNATAGSTGTITIVATAVKDNANINGIEITSAAAPVAFNDYTTFGYDNQRDVFNPNSTAITPASLPNIHLAWQASLGNGDYNTQTQPVLATEIPGHQGVLYVGGGSGNVYAYDALSGALMWTHATGQQQYSCENGYNALFGIGGSVAYDPGSKSIYVVGNTNTGAGTLATNTLYRLDGAAGSVLGQVAIASPNAAWPSLDFAHTSVTLGNGMAYVGTGATCDISSWRGRVVAVNAAAMTVVNTFFPAWNGTTQPWGGGGVWGWGGVSLDTNGNVYTGVGNTDNGTTTHGTIVAPFSPSPYEYSANGDSFVELSSDVSTLEASNLPIAPSLVQPGSSNDLDLNGTPVIFTPNGAGCDTLAAVQGKAGSLFIYDTTRINSGPIAQYQLAPSTYADGFLGEPAYSPVTGLLYVGVPSSNSSLFPPGMIAINPGCGTPSVAWNTAFGPDSYEPGSSISPGVPRSVPAVSAGGVIFIGTMCTVSGSSCSPTTTSSIRRRADAARRIPLICCAAPGTGGGAVWALNATTGAVLNGGNPLIITAGPLRMAPTIDGSWIYVLDNNGNMYGLTIDPSYPAIQSKHRAVPAKAGVTR